MFRQITIATCAVLSLVLSACASETFARDDAVTALQTTGVSEVEAACMADTLVALGQLDAANPQQTRGPEHQEAFLTASNRCVRVEVLSVTEDGAVVGSVGPAVDARVSTDDGEEGGEVQQVAESEDGEFDQDALIAAAAQQLELFGRSPERAACIVEHLASVEAWHVLANPSLGLGLDAFEADAMAACATVR